ncbi:hypothetical protein Tco_1135928, partial [Tanacetum coccineum]
ERSMGAKQGAGFGIGGKNGKELYKLGCDRERLKMIKGMFVGPTSSLGIIAGERIPHEASPARIPQRHVAGDNFPQRHVAGESPDMSPGKRAIVVV